MERCNFNAPAWMGRWCTWSETLFERAPTEELESIFYYKELVYNTHGDESTVRTKADARAIEDGGPAESTLYSSPDA